MIPTKRSGQHSHSRQSSPPSYRGSPSYSPPYESNSTYSRNNSNSNNNNNNNHKRANSRRSSVGHSRQGSVETNIDEEQSINNPTGSSTATNNNNGNNNSTDLGAGNQENTDINDKDDNDPEEDDKDELIMDDDMHAQMEKAKENMKLLLENFSDDQLQRYEAYRRSALNRNNVKRLVSQVMNQQCSQTMAFVVAGFAKVYVGEIIEKARQVMEEAGDTGTIRPDHIREAHRRYKLDHSSSSGANVGKKLLLKR